MANNTERIDQLGTAVNMVSTEQKLLAQQVQQAVEADRLLREDLTKLRDEVQKLQAANSVLRTEVDDLKKARDLWGTRVWHVVAGVILAVVGGVIGYLLKR